MGARGARRGNGRHGRQGERARVAAAALAAATAHNKDAALVAMAERAAVAYPEILAANAADLATGPRPG